MKYCIAAILLLCICIASVGAITENFQSWGSSVISVSSGSYVVPDLTGVGNLSMQMGSSPTTLINTNPLIWSYAGFDGDYDNLDRIYLLDANMNVLDSSGLINGSSALTFTRNSRAEINFVGMTPEVFLNGVYKGNLICTGPNNPLCSIYPSYLEFVDYTGGRRYDNIVIGGSDPHVVGALPSNWTIQRDLLNPSAIGVYAWNNGTQAWNLQNSNYFYIDADTSSQQAATTENFDILNYNTGLIVNTTVINDQTSPHNQLQFNIANFLNTVTNLGTQLPDGEYTAEFRGYPTSAAYFWVISSGAIVSWDKTTYPQNAQAILTYSISNSYYQPSTYTYSLAVVSTSGSTLQTYNLNSQTGTESLSLNSATYSPGAYYAEILATPIAGGTAQIMNYAAAQVTSYVYISGYVNDAQTALPLTNANVSISQTGTNASELTSASGAYSFTQGWLTGSTLSIQTNLSGYTNDIDSFSPLGAGTINLNISLLSTTPSFTGTAAGGILKDNQYGNPIPSAMVYYQNTSHSQIYSNTTNNAGYYYTPGLTHTYLYNAWGEKSGYANTTIPVVSP